MSKNIITRLYKKKNLNEKKDINLSIGDSIADQLHHALKEFSNGYKEFAITSNKPYRHEYYKLYFKKKGKYTFITEEFRSENEIFYRAGKSKIDINDFKQILLLGKYFSSNKTTIKEIEEIIYNPNYNFHVWQTIYENLPAEELVNQGNYGLIKMCKEYITHINKNKELDN